MLRQRLATAAVLAVVMVLGILLLPTPGFAVLLLIFLLLGAWEWAGLSALSRPRGRAGYCAVVLVLAVASWGLLGSRGFLLAALALVCLFWCYALVWLRRYTADPGHRDPALILQLAGLAVLLGPWIALLDLHGGPGYGPGHVLFLMALVWIADSGAYFSGRRWGRRKLAPAISPGKTREGGIGALVVTLAVALVGALAFGLRAAQWPLFVLICLVTVAFSIAGDLFESMAKRQCGVKDSGSLLPGHGGMMDRLDSLTAAAPVFLFGLQGLTP